MPRLLRILLTGSAFFFFFVGSGLIGWFVLPLLGLGTRDAARIRRRRSGFMLRAYRLFTGYMQLVGLISFRPPPLPDVFPETGPYVVIANHPTLIDVILILATVPGVGCLVKAKLFSHFFIGPVIRRAGYVSGPSASDADARSVLDSMVAALEGGTPLLVFPEGTRSPAGALHRFRRGAIEAAARTGVPVIPIVIECDPPRFLGKGQAWFDVPARRVHIGLRFLSFLRPSDGTDSARALTKAITARYEIELSEFYANSEGRLRTVEDDATHDDDARSGD